MGNYYKERNKAYRKIDNIIEKVLPSVKEMKITFLLLDLFQSYEISKKGVLDYLKLLEDQERITLTKTMIKLR